MTVVSGTTRNTGQLAPCMPLQRRWREWQCRASLPIFSYSSYTGVHRNAGEISVSRLRQDLHSSYDMGICSRGDHPLLAGAQYCGMFKTPTLRNVATRKVFFHNGKIKSLNEALRFYNTRDTAPELWYPKVNGVVHKFDDLPAKYRANIDTQMPR